MEKQIEEAEPVRDALWQSSNHRIAKGKSLQDHLLQLSRISAYVRVCPWGVLGENHFFFVKLSKSSLGCATISNENRLKSTSRRNKVKGVWPQHCRSLVSTYCSEGWRT